MRILYVDTETTGFFKKELPLWHPAQPWIVSFAAIMTDSGGEVYSETSAIIEPAWWTIPLEASNVHGITTGYAKAHGVSWIRAMDWINELCVKADLVVAHNIEFDATMVAIMNARAMNRNTMSECNQYCTMKASTPICQLPGKIGSDYKWPKLAEAVRIILGEDLKDAHSAMGDVRACMKLYYALKKLEIDPKTIPEAPHAD